VWKGKIITREIKSQTKAREPTADGGNQGNRPDDILHSALGGKFSGGKEVESAGRNGRKDDPENDDVDRGDHLWPRG
jgi:hypothetical protein